MKLYKIIFLVVAIAGISSCKKMLDINTDPNNPSLDQLTPKLVFPSGVVDVAGRIGGDLAILGGIWAQYYTQSIAASQYKEEDSYNITKSYGQTNRGVAWVELYSGGLNDLTFVIRKSEEEQDWNYFLMGTVIRAYTLQVLVDLYDQIPYSEAFQGKDNLTPHFDDGFDVYQGLIAELDNALSKDFEAGTNSSPGAYDVIWPAAGGSVSDQETAWIENNTIDKWIRFANTLKLKMYLRMVNAEPTIAETGIRAMFDGGAQFLDEDASLDIFEDAIDKRNPFYTYNFVALNTSTNLRASRTLLTFLQANNDPRIDDYYDPSTAPSTFTGINQGDFSNDVDEFRNASIVTIGNTAPVDFITEGESYFLQAEALERFYGGAGAKAQYDAGVTASFAKYGDNAAPFIASGGAYEYPSGGFEAKLEAIIMQKWTGFPGSHSLEAFFEHNRTGYPLISPVYSDDPSYIPGQFVYAKNGVTVGLFPKRLIFPDLETSKNSNAPPDQPITKPVWWDVEED